MVHFEKDSTKSISSNNIGQITLRKKKNPLILDQTRETSFDISWLVVLGFNATLTAQVISWCSVTHMFPGFLTSPLTQLFFPKPLTTFLACFCRGERRKYEGKKVPLNQELNSQSPGHESCSHGLTHYQTTNFRLFQSERVCR